MAGATVAILDRLVLVLGFGNLLLEIIVAVEAELADGLDQQVFEIGGVRAMAVQALAVVHRLMFILGGFGRRVVALPAQSAVGADQQVGIRGLVGIVTGRALAIVHRLVLDLSLQEEVLMAGETDFSRLAGHSLGRL